MKKTGENSVEALSIDYITTLHGGAIGMSQCPGRSSLDITGKRWQNDLDTDIQAIKDAGFSTVISLLSHQELTHHGAGEIEKKLLEVGINWLQFSIDDYDIPHAITNHAWQSPLPRLLAQLKSGKKILIHCAGGRGRTGMMSASLLNAMGIDPNDSISIVRKARPGAIETKEQEDFIKGANT